MHDPDPSDTTFEMILLYLIRDLTTRAVKVVEDRHTLGLFPYETWTTLIEQAGFDVQPIDPTEDAAWELCSSVKPKRRSAGASAQTSEA